MDRISPQERPTRDGLYWTAILSLIAASIATGLWFIEALMIALGGYGFGLYELAGVTWPVLLFAPPASGMLYWVWHVKRMPGAAARPTQIPIVLLIGAGVLGIWGWVNSVRWAAVGNEWIDWASGYGFSFGLSETAYWWLFALAMGALAGLLAAAIVRMLKITRSDKAERQQMNGTGVRMKPSGWFVLAALLLVVGFGSWVTMSGDNFVNNAKLLGVIVGIGGGVLAILIGALSLGVKSGVEATDQSIAREGNGSMYGASRADELAKYGDLLERDLISQAEYDEQKHRLLA